MSLSRRALVSGLVALSLLAGCSNADPLADSEQPSTPDGKGTTLVVGSQMYYSNEIIAELYAQALTDAGYDVQRQYQIGQRETYLPEITAGKIDVFPEYGGNLLQYLDPSATASTNDEISAALDDSLPAGLRALPSAEASDQDSFNVTQQFADQHSLRSLFDLAGIPGLKIAANSEFANRPYGPEALKRAYGIDIELVPVEDSGGPLTVKALTDGTVQVADIYSADPAIARENLVTLEDPENLVLPQRITPIVSDKVDDKAEQAIAAVNAQLSSEQLQQLNQRSVDEQASSADIAEAWLKGKGLIG